MNQNNQNQVPVQNDLVNALMNYLQPLQLQAQAGAQIYPQFQQQPLQQWPGWQPQGPIAVPGGAHHAQQWMGQPVVQQQRQRALGAEAGPAPLVNEIATAVAAAVQPFLQDRNAPPVGSKPDDEQILIEALKKAKSSGLTPRQAMEKLHGVNDHTETGWKNYFLDHLEKMYPKVYRDTPRRLAPYVEIPPHPSTSRSQAGSSSVSIRKDVSRSVSPGNPIVNARVRGKSPGYSPPLPRRHVLRDASPPRRRVAEGNGEGERTSSPSPMRSKRGDPADDYHAGTHIPSLVAYSKPKAPPPRQPGIYRFTNDEKVFFIQYLRWRVRRRGPIPTRFDLYAELAKQTPHCDADAWKRHWDEHPELPDRILIEARNKARADSQNAVDAISAGQDDDSNSAENDNDDVGAEDNAEQDENDGSWEKEGQEDEEDETAEQPHLGNGQGKKTQKRMARRRITVTESDIRAMARYRADKDAVWDDYPSYYACWEEFAKQNPKRSRSAWMSVALRRSEIIEELARKYLQDSEEGQKPPSSPITLNKPSETSVFTARPQIVNMGTMGCAGTSQKRALETRPAELELGYPSRAQKRVKHELQEYIDLTSD